MDNASEMQITGVEPVGIEAATTSAPSSDTSSSRTESLTRSQYQAQCDQIYLSLIRAQTEGLHGVLDLVDKVVDPEGGERGGKKEVLKTAIRLPLNQLTWPEFARMLIAANCFKTLRGDPSQAGIYPGVETQVCII